MKLPESMIYAMVAISTRDVTIHRNVGIIKTYSEIRENGKRSTIKVATIDALIKRNLVVSKMVSAYRPGYGSESRLWLDNGVAERFSLFAS